MSMAEQRTTRLRSLVRLAAVSVLLACGASVTKAAEPLKVGFVYVGPIGDSGWTYQHDLGRKQMEETLGDKVDTTYIENVAEGDAERVIRKLAADGHGLVFTTTFGYMNPTLKVAAEFPGAAFEHASGYKRADNVGTYSARFHEASYLAGIVAGKMTKTNVAGYVATFPIPVVIRGINAFAQGMRSVNPDARLKVVWVSTWYDPPIEREAALALMAHGADVVTHHTDSSAVVQAAEDRGVYAIGYNSDLSKYGPNAHLTAITHHWGDFYTRTARGVLAKDWRSSDVWGSMKEGYVALSPLNKNVPQDVVQLVETARAEMIAGNADPFMGPVKDTDGKTRVPAGQVASDGDLAGMDWYVEGVEGGHTK